MRLKDDCLAQMHLTSAVAMQSIGGGDMDRISEDDGDLSPRERPRGEETALWSTRHRDNWA